MSSKMLRGIFQEIMKPDVELQNTASVARDHMANERTYLAWLRLSLMFTSAGVAIAQLFRLSANNGTEQEQRISTGGRAIGCVFVAMGMTAVIVACLRFFRVQNILQTGKFPAARFSVLYIFVVSLALIMVALGMVISAAV